MINSPYRFVPLSKFVYTPEWANQVTQDIPFKEGLCGSLEFTLTAQGRLCVGGEQEASTTDKAGKINFYRSPDNKLAIPGTSLKGMLRSVLEIATFSHFRQVEDQSLSVRDISKTTTQYYKKMTGSKAGWLRFTDNQWLLTPCEFGRIRQQDIIDSLKINQNDWKKATSVPARYNLLNNQIKNITCSNIILPLNNNPNAKKIDAQGDTKGKLVVTGQPGGDYSKRGSKKWEFVFFNENEKVNKNVHQKVIETFMEIHDTDVDDSPWSYWRNNKTSGIPVFWHGDGNNVTSLGLAMMYRLAYPNTLHDAISYTSEDHLTDKSLDMADLIFGCMADNSGSPNENQSENHSGLKGRVNISMAQATEDAPETRFTEKMVLSSPKPGFYPSYIRQENENQWRTLFDKGVKLAGWKRYKLKDYSKFVQQMTIRTEKPFVKLEYVPAGTQFTGTIRLHNLLPVELGALLWAIDFGDPDKFFHSLGMGKPFGLGQVSLEVNTKNSHIIPNNMESNLGNNDEVLQACKNIFTRHMGSFWTTPYEKTVQISELQELAKKVEAVATNNYPISIQEFTNIKRDPEAYSEVQEIEGENVDIKPQSITLVDEIAAIQNMQATKVALESAEGIDLHIIEIKQLILGDRTQTIIRKLKQKAKVLEEFFNEENTEGTCKVPEEILTQLESLEINEIAKRCKRMRTSQIED